MKPLATNHRVLTWFCICPADGNVGKPKKILYAIFSLFCAGSMICFFVASVMYISKNISTDLDGSLFALIQAVVFMSVLYMLVVAFIMRRKLTEIFNSLSDIWNTNKTENSFRFLAGKNEICEWMWQIYFKYILFGSVTVLLTMYAISVLISLLIYGFSDSLALHLFRPSKFILPWNQQTLLSYFSEVFFVAVVQSYYFIVNGAFLLLFISLCQFHCAFHTMFQHSIRTREFSATKQNGKEFQRDLIRFHNSVKGLFLNSAEVYSPLIMVQLICCMIYLAATVFHLDMQLQSLDFGVAILLMLFSTGISNLFIYCYFGKLATDSFEKMSDLLYETDWYELSVDLQKNFVLMIQNTQRRLHYHGFGVAVLNLITFTQFIKTVFTYYMMLKTLASK